MIKISARCLAVLARATVTLAALGLGVLAFSAEPASSTPDSELLRATLENGLKVVIVRNTLAPVVTTALNYMVGADETPKGFPGMAHAQEHMMFRGSPGLSADQLASLGGLMGGSFNANTRQTVTQYLYTIPAGDLDVALHIEALRMRNVLDTDKDWQQERGAIEQEVASDLSNPQYVVYSQLREALFRGTSYAHDALGSKASFDRTTAQMLRDFHARWYAPNNALLVVVGDIDTHETLDKIKALFGPIAPKVLPARPALQLPAIGPRSLRLHTDLPYAMALIALRMPGVESPDFPALEVLADVLSSQRGALYGLVPAGKAISAGFSFEALPLAGIGSATLTFPEGGDAQSLLADVQQILAQTAAQGVASDLVDAAKLQERRAAEFQKNSIEGLATAWSDAIAIDGADSPDADLARIETVSVADVNRVARLYLSTKNATIALLTPEGSGKPVASAGFGGQESIALGEIKPTPLPAWAGDALERIAVPPSTLKPTTTHLANGITLIVQPEDVSDTVTVSGHIRNRPELQVPAGKEGLTLVLDQLYGYGSDDLDRVGFQRALDEIGADEQAGSDFQVSVLKDHFERGVELLADNELRPALPEEDFETIRRQTAETVASRLKSPGYLAGHALRGALFPKGDPTLREATPQSIAALTLDDIKRYREQSVRPDLAVIVVIGHVTVPEAQRVIEKYFGSWAGQGDKPDTLLPPVPPNGPSVTGVPDRSRVQDDATLAETLALTRASPDIYALRMGNNILGGGFYSTRLSLHLRKEAGLVYSIGSELEFGQTRSVYLVQYACDPKNLDRVQASIVRELQTMQTSLVTPDELLRSKSMMLRQIPLDEASTEAISQGFMHLWELNLPLEEPTLAAQHYVDLTAPQIRDAFAQWLRPADLVRVTQGP